MEELIFDGIREMLHNLRMWSLSQWHLFKACRNESIVDLLISMCYDEEETSWNHTKDKKDIICSIGSGTYHGQMGNPQSLTLIEAFHIPLLYAQFADEIISDRATWPSGVEYSVNSYRCNNEDIQLTIKVFIDLDYKDSPKDYLRGYMNYIHELQTEIHKAYNQYRKDHPINEQIPQYNIL